MTTLTLYKCTEKGSICGSKLNTPININNSIATPHHHLPLPRKKKKNSLGIVIPFPALRIFLNTNTGYIMIYANISPRSEPLPGAY